MVAGQSLFVSSLAILQVQNMAIMKKVIKMAKEKVFLASENDDEEYEEEENQITILGEIVGATNLVAAKREREEIVDASDHSDQNIEQLQKQRNELINSYVIVYWGDEIIHRTKIIRKK